MSLVSQSLPRGTVTFLFTDVEGSTRLLRDMGEEAYANALDDHRRVVRNACRVHGGVEVDTQGDAFFVAFPTAPSALKAAAATRDALQSGPIRVRTGIHTGTPLSTAEGYIGHDVHRAARIASAGHGGQVLVSASAAALVGTDGLRDLGEHRLKDLSAPERIYQLGNDEFPPLKSLHQTNLPIPATPFIGRERNLREVLETLYAEDVRLLTLTGPGGTGKTRLGLQAAGAASDRFAHGVWWVPLAALRDPALVLATAAQVVGAKDGLADHVADKSMLLLFDNFEQVVDAAADLAGLLGSCPNLHVLVTSRELLRVPGEQAYPVPPLNPEEGAELFAARAHAADSGFDPDTAISELCTRLENLPLALELAAARVRVLSPAQLLERLAQRLDLLKAGRGVDPRQQTLRATIEWSHDLLSEDERRLFARLAVFRGGCTLETAEEISDADLDTLQALVDKSLLRHTHERFWMLETIREYAAERFEDSAEADALRRQHAEFFLSFAEQAATELEGPHQAVWFTRLAAEQDNLRAALVWSSEAGDGQTTLQVAAALWRFWWMRGALAEGRRWYELAFASAPDAPASLRAKALYGSGNLALTAGAVVEGQQRYEQALELYRLAGDDDGVVRTLYDLGSAHWNQDRPDVAERLYEEALELARATGNLRGESIALGNLAYFVLQKGETERAAKLLHQTLALDRLRGDDYAVAASLENLALLDLREGRLELAAERLAESLARSRALEDNLTTGQTLVVLAALAIARGDAEAAARVLGAGAEVREPLGLRLDVMERELHEQTERAARAQLGVDAFAAALGNGRRLTPEEALAVALDAKDRELRELARGIHPTLLRDEGLGAAVEALARRTPLPVTMRCAVRDRLPDPVELAAYFVVAEALTNVVKHAAATEVSVLVEREPDALRVKVRDDGVGAARITADSGLAGLRDRLEALDATLAIESEPGRGTTVYADIPCGS
jgi:predicted ATPase/class 3 adenylate cyclase/Tfp pilus assembly protein PilF